MGRINVNTPEKKGGRGAEYESFAFGFSANTAEILNANRSHLHDTAITRISDTNDSHLHLI